MVCIDSKHYVLYHFYYFIIVVLIVLRIWRKKKKKKKDQNTPFPFFQRCAKKAERYTIRVGVTWFSEEFRFQRTQKIPIVWRGLEVPWSYGRLFECVCCVCTYTEYTDFWQEISWKFLI